jgi:hypothetical protein
MPDRSASGKFAAFVVATYGYGLLNVVLFGLPFLFFIDLPSLRWWQWLMVPLALGIQGYVAETLHNAYGVAAQGPNGDRWRLFAAIVVITLLLAVSAAILYFSRLS